MCRFLLSFLLCSFSALGFAENEKIVVAAFEYPPIYQDGKDKGLSGDIVVAAFKAASIDADLLFLPVERMVLAVNKGQVVCGIGGTVLFSAPEVANNVSVSAVIQYVYQTFLYDTRRFPAGLDFAQLDEMKKFNIGVLRGSGIMRFLEKTPELSLFANNHHEGSARQLKSGRIDVWAIVDLTGMKYMNELFPEEAAAYKYTKAFNLGDVSVVFSKKTDPDGQYERKFKAGLAAIKKNGIYMQIMSKYYGGKGKINRFALSKDMR